MTVTSSSFTVRTSLLAAVARWSADDGTRPHLECVVFRDGEFYATDGIRLVRVPIDDKKFQISIKREHILAAARTQAEIKTNLRVKHDHGPGVIITAGPDDKVSLDVGSIVLTSNQGEFTESHTRKLFDDMEPIEGAVHSPDGYIVNASIMASIADVEDSVDGDPGKGVRLLRWGGPLYNGQRLEPLVMEGSRGIRFVIMPMRTK